MELYFAVNKETGEIFNSMGFYANKVSYVKLAHLKALFTNRNIDKNKYNFYRVSIINKHQLLKKLRWINRKFVINTKPRTKKMAIVIMMLWIKSVVEAARNPPAAV